MSHCLSCSATRRMSARHQEMLVNVSALRNLGAVSSAPQCREQQNEWPWMRASNVCLEGGLCCSSCCPGVGSASTVTLLRLSPSTSCTSGLYVHACCSTCMGDCKRLAKVLEQVNTSTPNMCMSHAQISIEIFARAAQEAAAFLGPVEVCKWQLCNWNWCVLRHMSKRLLWVFSWNITSKEAGNTSICT